MPSVGLGTWKAEPGAIGDAVITAVKGGYRHIDCARVYGNEKEIGVALKELFSNGIVKREEMWITSKLWCSDFAPEDVSKALSRTLADLQLDYVDLYLAYSPLGSPGSWVKGEILKDKTLIQIAEKLNKSPAQVALRWGLQAGHSVLPKSTNKTRIEENLNLFDWCIPQDLFSKFSEIPQARLLRGDFAVHETCSPYKSLEELWDGEI